jgi:hypothetical protein
MKKSSMADVVERTVDFLERTGADMLAQHYLNFALSSFAQGCEEQLAHYLLRYEIAAERPRAVSAQLVLKFEGKDISFVLDPYANLIGRIDPQTRSYPNIDLTNYDVNSKISRRHAKIYSMDGCNFWIEDLGSFNGTVLNGQRISPRQPHPIHDADQVMFGNILVVFRSPIVVKPTTEL